MQQNNHHTRSPEELAQLDYASAVSEFDRLWASQPDKQTLARAEQLAIIIHAFEGRMQHSKA